jgi:hypothetical protein
VEGANDPRRKRSTLELVPSTPLVTMTGAADSVNVPKLPIVMVNAVLPPPPSELKGKRLVDPVVAVKTGMTLKLFVPVLVVSPPVKLMDVMLEIGSSGVPPSGVVLTLPNAIASLPTIVAACAKVVEAAKTAPIARALSKFFM